MTSEATARLSIVLRYGRTATAFRAIGDDLAAWIPDPDALVAFAPVRGAAVAAGEPIAPGDRLVTVAEAFIDAQAGNGRRVSFFATEGRLAQAPRLTRRLIGEQPVWDPQRWTPDLRTHRSLREQVRRARAKGVVVESLSAEELCSPAMRRALTVLRRRWQALHSMPAMGFLVAQALEEGAVNRLTFIARRGEHLVGVLSMAPVPARDGWLLEHLLRDPDAPNGTAELLVDSGMRTLAARGVFWATLGLAPLHGAVDTVLARIRDWSTPLFNFTGLSGFKRKLRPTHWEPIYLAWPRGQSGWQAILDGLRAFAGGSLLRFALKTALRGPQLVLRMLELLLVPWILLLGLAPTTPWFPSASVQYLWVTFDVLLLLALGQLRRWSQEHGRPARHRSARLALGLAISVSIDALLTGFEAWWHPVTWQQGLSGRLATIIACVGPVLAALMLWGTAGRLRILDSPPAVLPVRQPSVGS